MLDTSVLVAAERRTLSFGRLLEHIGDDSVGIAALTASELLHGCHRATDPRLRARRFAFVESLLECTPVYSFGLIEARQHAELWATLAREGTLVGAHDVMIGATAVAHGLTLATLNARDFGRMPGLQLLDAAPFVVR